MYSPSRPALPEAIDCTCVYSHEPPRVGLLPLTDQQIKEGASSFGAVDVDHFRVRVMPVSAGVEISGSRSRLGGISSSRPRRRRERSA